MRFPRTCAWVLLCALSPALPSSAPAQVAGVYREVYTNLNRQAFSLARLTNYPNFLLGRPDQTNITTTGLASSFAGDDFAQRLRAYLIPPSDGAYVFSISSDETSNLLLGTDENPATKRRIAWVDPRAQPGNYTTHYGQQSLPVSLQAGRRYYVEVLHHEANLMEHLSVQWRLPAGTIEGPIPNTRLVCEIAPLIVSNLVNLTVEEGRPAEFAPVLANFLPQSFRWQRGGVDVPGGTDPAYRIDATTLADNNALIRAFITNRVGLTNTAEAILTVLRDTNAPTVVSVLNVNATNLFVTFSEPVTASAVSLARYQLPGVTLLGAELSSDGKTVILRTSPLTFGGGYALSVNGVQDRAGTPNTLAPVQIPFTAAQFNARPVGEPVPIGSITLVGNGADVIGGGSAIGDVSDQFQFAWQSVTGDFDVRVRVESLGLADVLTRSGLMARETLDDDSRFAAAFATPTLAGCFFEARTNAGWQSFTSGSYPASYPSMWLRLRRAGSLFSGFASQDGVQWSTLHAVSLALSNRLYLGFAVSSHDTNQTATAVFRQYSPVSGGTIDAVPARLEPLGPSSRKTGLVISEIMYHPRDVFLGTNKAELEFVEIFNSNPYYEDISGYRLSGDIEYTFPAGTILRGGRFLVVARAPADAQTVYGMTGALGPFTNNLPNDRGRLRLRNNNGFILLEANYDSRPPWPAAADGAGHSLVLARPSYGENHREAWAASDAIDGSPGRLDPVGEEALRSVVINEFRAHTDPPLTDFIELFNTAPQAVDLGGAWLSDNFSTNKFRFPSPTIIPARGFLACDQTQLGFSLSSAGERILLVNSNQTRVIDALVFGPQAQGVAFGRFPDGALPYQELAAASANLPNAGPLTRDIVINEIMFHPISENSDDEYIELYNKGAGAIDLGGWRFTDGISFRFPSNTVIAAGGYLVVARSRTNLLAHYSFLASNPSLVVGDYDGELANDGERLALTRPEIAINSDNPSDITTNLIQVVVDEVEYRDGGRWGRWSDGGGSSLELTDPRADNRLAANWADSDETSKAPWTNIELTGVLDNGLAAADALHVVLLEEGECLLDDVEVFPVGSGNRIANGTFETGLAGWVARGTHERSSLENSGFNSARSLHIRASSRGDVGANQVRVPFTTAPSGNTTIRAKVRWLRGWPEILLRLRGSFLEATDRMIVPSNLGTPGAPNSRFTANAAPAITEATHTPIVPPAGRDVLVTARISDVDGLSGVVLKYRVDPATALTIVPMNDAGESGDAVAGDGVFTAVIPGQPADTMVAFSIEATDGAAVSPALARFPALRDDNGPVRECLIHFGSPVPAGGFGTYRFWLTQQAITNWAQREVLSNERVPGTFVYGNHRVIYESGSRYAGSAAHQDQAAPDYSPVGTPNNYTFDMPRDELVLGTDNFNKVHGAGNNHHDDNTLQRETTAYWMAQELGLPANYKRFVAMYINGARRGTLMEDTQVPNGEVIESVFPDDAEGDLFKVSVWYEFTTGTAPVLGTAASSEAYLNNYTTTGGSKKRARYRWNWQPRAVHGSANDFSNLYALIDAANASTNGGYPAYGQNLDAVADMENWMRTFALEHALGNWDSFGYRNQQNMFAYKPEHDRWSLIIWDINIIFGGGTRGTPVATNETLLEIDTADTGMNAIFNTPAFRRPYWRALQEIANGVFLPGQADEVMDSRFAAFEGSGVHVTAPDLIKHWIAQRRSYVLAELEKIDSASFGIAGPADFTSPTNLIVLNGVAPLGLRNILINGAARPVTWTTLTNWTLRIAVDQPVNQLLFSGTDSRGNPIPGVNGQVTVTYTGPLVSPQDFVVINEIMYHPTNPGASFVEILNRGPVAFELSGWRLNGLDYTFPSGAILTTGQVLVLAENRTTFLASYPTNTPPPFDVFDGKLDADGETLTLFKPGATNAEDLVIDKVRYEARLPWATNAQGDASLQLIDPAQDNSRPSNWTDRQGWQQVIFTGTISGGATLGTNLAIFSSGAAGDFFVDDIVLVTGAVANVGLNLVVNGNFESSGSWDATGNHTNSIMTSETAHTGNRSMHVIGVGLGGPASAVRQMLPAFPSNTVCTMNYWIRPGTNGVQAQIRAFNGSLFSSIVSIRPANATPGFLNNDQRTLPAYAPLWLNEIQSDNTAGPVDNFGERGPWIELYNAGTSTLSLDGYFLANNYDTNLNQWPFPPGTSIGPGQFRLLWADGEPGETAGANLHTSFRLNSTTGAVALVRLSNGQPQITDYLTYTQLGPALSYGDFPDGQPFTRRVFQSVTPGGTNAARRVEVFINEWMASNTNSLADPSEFPNLVFDDWFELYNPGPDPVDLGGFWLTDNLSNPRGFQVPGNGAYVIPPGGFLLVWADEDSVVNQPDLVDLHVNFRLNAAREEIGLFAPDLSLIDAIRFTNQVSDVSQGRFADGASAIYAMTTPTPRGPNTLGGNTPPQLALIADQTVMLGRTLTFVASATDLQVPPQTLSFSLEGNIPSGATIGAASGVFTFTPTAGQTPSTNVLTVRVTDSGVPPLSTARSFTLFVVGPPRLNIIPPFNGGITLTLPVIPGRTYRIEYKANLNDPGWTALGGNRLATTAQLTVTDSISGQAQRFYRVVVLD